MSTENPVFTAHPGYVGPISQSSPTSRRLQGMDTEAFLQDLLPQVAHQIVAEWRQSRSQPGIAKAREESIAIYELHTRRLENRYADELRIDVNDLSPVELVRCFFYHARELSPASWKLYRYGLLHVLNARAESMAKKHLAHDCTIRAIAALITFARKPYVDERHIGIKRVRPKTIRRVHLKKLMDEMQTGHTARRRTVRRARMFAMATLATGLRPSEWDHAELRDALDSEVPGGVATGWKALVIRSAKRKDYEPDWIRTLLLEPGLHQIMVLEHLRLRGEFLAKSDEADAARRYVKRCSNILSSTCAFLWPDKPERWITLYTLRSQARANIASRFGTFVAAAMMGHSVRKSQDFYGGKHRANLARGGGNRLREAEVPVPGLDCLAKAWEFELRHEREEALPEFEAPESGNEF